MAMNISELEPHIKRILTAPDVDLSSVTARHVRKQLLEEIPSLTPEFLKTNKAEVNTLIAQVFGDVRDEEGEDEKTVEMEDENDRQSRASSTRKRKQESGDEADEGADEKPAKKSKKSKNGQEDTDARLARQLSSEINARVSRRVTTTKKNGVAKKRTKKSSATVESDDEMAGEKPKKKRGRGGLTKEYYLSEPLSALMGQDKLPRPQVVKKLWEHIKANEMQNPEKRTEILCDKYFKAIFGVEKIDMFKMNKVLGQHLREGTEQV